MPPELFSWQYRANYALEVSFSLVSASVTTTHFLPRRECPCVNPISTTGYTLTESAMSPTIKNRLQNSLLKESSLFKPVFGDAAKMGKVVTASPALVSPKMQGGFKADLGAMLQLTPAAISGPSSVLKKVVR